MNAAWFIAKRMIFGEVGGKQVSRPIIRIATVGVILGMAVMILSVAIVTGFRQEVREKVIGFGSHIRVFSLSSEGPDDLVPIERDQPFYPSLDTVDGVRHIQVYGQLPAILETENNIHGVVLKGIGRDFDTAFFQDKIQEGRLPDLSEQRKSEEVLISDFISKRLELGVGEEMTVYLVQDRDNINPRPLTISGIYDSGLERFDKRFILADIRHIEEVKDWGLEAQIRVDTACDGEGTQVEALGFKGKGNYEYNWTGVDWVGKGPHRLCTDRDTSLYFVLTDETDERPDTAFLEVKANKETGKGCLCGENVRIETRTSGGSGKYYTGGFEVMLESYEDLQKMDRIIYDNIGYDLQTLKITETNKDIFSWLEMLNINVAIIIFLLVGVAAITMTSVLLVLIIERTNMIGLLKSMGATNWQIRKIFLYNAGWLLGRGLIFGDLIGIGLALLQKYTGFVTLSEEAYYVSKVHVILQWDHILLLNIGTLLLCVLVLLIPSWLITRISPVRAIRFE